MGKERLEADVASVLSGGRVCLYCGHLVNEANTAGHWLSALQATALAERGSGLCGRGQCRAVRP